MPRYIYLLTSVLMMFTVGCRSPRLMSYAKFSKLEDLNLPRVLNLESREKSLRYIGTYHSNDKNDDVFRFVEEQLEEFQPDFVFHEGGSNWPIYKDSDSTKLISGEY